ncbi:MAG TPA: lyase family protein, partial [Stellaceae bacterium]|nr:lyase family protein [Stellaceae bacterium]
MSALLTPLLGSIELDALFADRARVQAMLDVEAALARAQARLGMIPEAAAAAIEAEARAETFDLPSLGRDTARAGNPAIPLVRELTRKVAERNEEAARFVHWGATSQDVIDTALVLQWRASLGPITRDLDRLGHVLAAHIEADAATPMIGRTWLQHALPITFGFKVAGWLDAILRHRQRLRAIRPRLLVLQLGGAAGTLASLGSEGLMVAQALARELDLALPDIPWHSAR